MSFARYDVERRSTKSSIFYNQINTIIDWKKIEKVIKCYLRLIIAIQDAVEKNLKQSLLCKALIV